MKTESELRKVSVYKIIRNQSWAHQMSLWLEGTSSFLLHRSKVQRLSKSVFTAVAREDTAAEGVMNINSALQEVQKTSFIPTQDILKASKASDKRRAHLCVLTSNCDELMDVKLVEALCAQHQINLIKVDVNRKPGEWVSLCKTD